MTIKDIARIAQVTHSTVSRSLNDSPLVSEETKARIKQIAREHGYAPNSLARRLATRRSHTLGLYFLSRGELDFMENFGTQFLTGITNACYAAGYDLLLFTLPHGAPNAVSYLHHCRERQVEGVIFIGLTSDDQHIDEIRKAAIPVSVIDFPLEGPQVASIGTDTEHGIRLAMDHLADTGHRRIAFIGGPAVSPVAIEREAVYRRILEARNAWDPVLVQRGNFSRESGYARALDLLAGPALPDAILAANDSMALGAIRALKGRGIRVPQDISVMGYDNAAGSDSSDPALTTIGQNPVAIGEAAVRLILDRLEGRPTLGLLRIEPRLDIRETERQATHISGERP